MRSEIFNEQGRTKWPLFTTIGQVRSRFPDSTSIQVAIGGWGNTDGFERAAKTKESRKSFAENIKTMLDTTGADGVDIDWEYPGGNGEDYKTHPNIEKEWQISAFPELLASIRSAIGPSKIISAAVPGLPRDMLAFTQSTIPRIMDSVDFLNIMTYDLMNRRDNTTQHHTGLKMSLQAIDTYHARGVPFEKMNLGLAFYVKWFKTAKGVDCYGKPVGCETELLEDLNTGADLGGAGGFSWHDEVPSELSESFEKAQGHGRYDEKDGGHFYWDREERLFWSWDTADAIARKLPAALEGRKLRGVFAWGLGEDAPKFEHLRATSEALQKLSAGRNDQPYRERNEL